MSSSQTKSNKGLVLSGGGARGAYQVGVLSAIADIARASGIQEAFDVYTGVSAGAINATFLAAGADDFAAASKLLVDLWSQMTSDKVFYSDIANLSKIGLNWMKTVSIGGAGLAPGQALLDTTPLHNLIRERLPFAKIQNNLDRGVFKGLAITALDYQASTAITFVQGQKNLPDWKKARRHSEKAQINAEHVMASSAIPLLFPPIGVGERYFGDGCIRNTAPCSPAIYLGCQKIMVIGVRRQSSTAYDQHLLQNPKAPSLARVLNVLLNSVMLDGIELDIERLGRINSLIDQIPASHHDSLTYKKVDFVWISPSADIGEIASQKHMKLPPVIRYLLKGLGNINEASEIVSYLLFDPSFCTQLIEIGYEDGMKQKEEIRKFLES
jgi:NTE family protein